MDRVWVEVEEMIMVMLPRSQWVLRKGEHPWDCDCMCEQLLAQEMGYC